MIEEGRKNASKAMMEADEFNKMKEFFMQESAAGKFVGLAEESSGGWVRRDLIVEIERKEHEAKYSGIPPCSCIKLLNRWGRVKIEKDDISHTPLITQTRRNECILEILL